MVKHDKNGVRWSYKRIFILMTLVMLVVAVFLWFAIGKLEQNFKRARERELAGSLTENLSAQIINRLDRYAELLFIIAHSTVTIMENFPEHPEMIENLYTEVLAGIPHFFQLRYIDPEGNEIHRVNKADNQVYTVGPEDLQNKNNRYYFQEAAAQKLWSLYISPLDLNIENGEIEIPWIPTLRMASPVPDPFSDGQGIVIINIDLTEALGIFYNENNNIKSYLLNSDGYYMAGTEKDKLWGFMFQNDTTFEKDYPEAWPLINSGERGSFIRSGKLYSYTTINGAALSERQMVRYESADGNIWKVVVVNDLHLDFFPSGSQGIIISAIILVISLAVGWGWSRSVYERKKAVFVNEKTKEALIKSEKMAALGRLVAGIAHELNTPIGSSVTIASTIQESLGQFSSEIKSGQIMKSRIDEFLSIATKGTDAMLESLNRASTLITHFKQVSVDQSSEQRRTFRLPDYINDILDTLKPTFKNRDITIDIKAGQSMEIDSYPGAFAQVLSNIINNAVIHGFPGESSGIITIEVLKQNDKVQIFVTDNGTGIPKENLDRIFEPFFTTSADIGGSGLGLHIVYNIVHDLLEGTLKVRSDTGKYTEFIIEIPLSIENKNKVIE